MAPLKGAYIRALSPYIFGLRGSRSALPSARLWATMPVMATMAFFPKTLTYERERETERCICIYTYRYMHTEMFIHIINIHIERERGSKVFNSSGIEKI